MAATAHIRILGISGSLRRGSYNTSLLRAAEAMPADGIQLEIATLHGIPLYDGDNEQADGIPASVSELKARIMACDGLLIATPEYNNSMPGVLKNAIDWLSRPPADIPKVFFNLPVAVIGASPSGFGTILSQNAWLPVFKTLGARQWAGDRLLVSKADRVFDAGGNMVDADARKHLADFLQGFAKFLRENLKAATPG